MTIESNGAAVVFAKELRGMKFSKRFWTDVGEHVEGGILDNITRGKQADGSAIKRNSAATLARKRELGRGSRSLVDDPRKHRFVQGSGQSWKTKFVGGMFGKTATGIIVVPATRWLKKISAILQSKGYTGWFGVSKKALAAIRKDLRKELKTIVKKAVKKANRK